MSLQFSLLDGPTASTRLFAFPGETIKHRADVVVKQRTTELEAENQILSSQIDQVGELLRNERQDRIKYQKLLLESSTCLQDIDQRMRRVCEEVEEQKRANLHLIDLMRGDHCGVSRLADPSQEEICGDCDDLSHGVAMAQEQGGSRTPPTPAASRAAR